MHDNDHDLLIEINTKLTMSIAQAEQRHSEATKAHEGLKTWVERLSDRVQKVEDKQILCDQNTVKLTEVADRQNIGFGILIAVQFGVLIWSHLVK